MRSWSTYKASGSHFLQKHPAFFPEGGVLCRCVPEFSLKPQFTGTEEHKIVLLDVTLLIFPAFPRNLPHSPQASLSAP